LPFADKLSRLRAEHTALRLGALQIAFQEGSDELAPNRSGSSLLWTGDGPGWRWLAWSTLAIA
jgi:hypothetical protein